MVDISSLLRSDKTRRQIEAALAHVRALREHLATIHMLDGPARESLRLEIDALADWASRHLPALQHAKGAPWPLLAEAERRLKGEAPLAAADVDDPLAAFERFLQTQRQARGGAAEPVATRGAVAIGDNVARHGDVPRTDAALAPSESALLATLTEKFYGSWAFRSLGLAIAAAVGIALCGDLVIGVKTISLWDSLKNAADNGEKAIEQKSDTTQKLLDNLSNDASDQSQRVNAEVTAAKRDLQDFRGSFETIRKDVSDRAIGWVSSALTSRATELARPMEERATTLASDIDKLRSDKLAPMQQQVATLATTAEAIRKALDDPALVDTLKRARDTQATMDDLSRLKADVAKLGEGAKIADRLIAESEKLKTVEAATDDLSKREAVVATRLSDFEKAVTGMPPAASFEGVAGAIATIKDEASKAVDRSGAAQTSPEAAGKALLATQASENAAIPLVGIVKQGAESVTKIVEDLGKAGETRQLALGKFDGDKQRLDERLKALNEQLASFEAIMPPRGGPKDGERLARALNIADAASQAASRDQTAANEAAAKATTAMVEARASASASQGFANAAGVSLADLTKAAANDGVTLGHLDADVASAEGRIADLRHRLDPLEQFLATTPDGMAQRLAALAADVAKARNLAEAASASTAGVPERLTSVQRDLDGLKQAVAALKPVQPPNTTSTKPAKRRARAHKGRRGAKRRAA